MPRLAEDTASAGKIQTDHSSYAKHEIINTASTAVAFGSPLYLRLQVGVDRFQTVRLFE
jgi:hypothetical protein